MSRRSSPILAEQGVELALLGVGPIAYSRRMRHWLLILSMLASLAVCPFNCMEQMSMGDGTAAPSGGCVCCAHCHTDSEAPAEPCSDSPCCDCICNGAVLATMTSISFDDVSVWGVDLLVVVDPVLSLQAAMRQDREVDRGRMRPGRSLHLALHSLQV